jgi:hypothetical protein
VAISDPATGLKNKLKLEVIIGESPSYNYYEILALAVLVYHLQNIG